MNQQKPEKPSNNPWILEVHSIFKTIQGEGPFAGTPAVFIRLAGCNLKCPFCDTDYTNNRQLLSPIDVLKLVKQIIPPSKFVVITGGEPFRQQLLELLVYLEASGYFVQIESNGTLNPPKEIAFEKNINKRQGIYIVCSPKTSEIKEEILKNSCALKYVINRDSIDTDGLPIQALGHPVNKKVARPPLWGPKLIYIQPEDSKDPLQNLKNLQAAIKTCLNSGYILQLQIHKIIGME